MRQAVTCQHLHTLGGKNSSYAPGITEVYLVDPDKDNSNPSSSLVGWPIVTKRSVETSDNEVGDTHSQGSSNQNGLSAEPVDVQYCRDCRGKKEDAANTTSKERCCVSSQAQIFEYECCIIQDSVYTRPYRSISRERPSKEDFKSDSHCWKTMMNTAATTRLNNDRFVSKLR